MEPIGNIEMLAIFVGVNLFGLFMGYAIIKLAAKVIK